VMWSRSEDLTGVSRLATSKIGCSVNLPRRLWVSPCSNPQAEAQASEASR